MDYTKAKRIMSKHKVTMIDKIQGTIFYPIIFIHWNKIAKREGISFKQATKDYFKILYNKK